MNELELHKAWEDVTTSAMQLIEINKMLYEENKRLNNIINEIEEYSKDRYYEEKKLEHYARLNAYKDILDKLQELKGEDKE